MPPELLGEIDRILTQLPIDFGGGCSVRKAYVMAWLIRRFRLTSTLDIGVYRGRSLFPQAIAHQLATGGTVYGVDPWSAAEADQNDHPILRDRLKAFARTTDFDGLFRQVIHKVSEFGLSKHTHVVRATSAQAASRFAAGGVSFGLIHIDGNHDTDAVMRDVLLYLPLLQPGGFLVMDDVSWDSVQPAEQEAASRARLLLRWVTPDKTDDYAIYWKDGPRLSAGILSLRLRYLADGLARRK